MSSTVTKHDKNINQIETLIISSLILIVRNKKFFSLVKRDNEISRIVEQNELYKTMQDDSGYCILIAHNKNFKKHESYFFNPNTENSSY
jgi:hypothetical protein